MTTTTKPAVRVFKIGSVTLPDPDPSLSPEEAVLLYAGSYPQVIDAPLTGPEINTANEAVYHVERPIAKTKG